MQIAQVVDQFGIDKDFAYLHHKNVSAWLRHVKLLMGQSRKTRRVLQDVASYEETQDTLALLKLLALGNQEVADGKTKPLTDVVKRLRAKHPKV